MHRVIPSQRWTFQTSRRAGGYEFQVRCNIPSGPLVLGRLLASFPPVTPRPEMPTYSLAWVGGERKPLVLDLDGCTIQEVEHAGSMVDWLVGDITRKAVSCAAGFVAVHAGVVSWNDRAVLLPARPDEGKTTTVAGLARAGFSFLSDELALLHLVSDLVHPFPRPLGMEASSLEVLDGLRAETPSQYADFRRRTHHIAPDDLRPNVLGVACSVAFVVVPRYQEGTGTTLSPMTKAETLFVLGENSLNLESAGSEGFATLGRIATKAPGYRLEIGDLTLAVDAVRRLFERAGTC